MFNPYTILDVVITATSDEIHIQYRKLSKTLHPDAGGGSEAFIELTKAYDILISPEKRKKYDETGTCEENVDLVVDSLQKLFIKILSECQAERVECTDFVGLMQREVIMQKGNCKSSLMNLMKMKEMQDRTLGKIKKRLKSKKNNFLLFALQQNLELINKPIREHQNKIDLMDGMLTHLENYEYEFDQMPASTDTNSQGMDIINIMMR